MGRGSSPSQANAEPIPPTEVVQREGAAGGPEQDRQSAGEPGIGGSFNPEAVIQVRQAHADVVVSDGGQTA